MRNTHVGIGIGLIAGVLALQSPAAAAAGDSGVHIRPGQATPGSTVTVSTTACGTETYGKGVSEVGGNFHLLAGDRKGVLTGQFVIPAGTDPGTDTVTVKCPPRIKITETYEIATARPNGAVEAGFGDADDRGTQLALGSALLAAGAAVGLVRVRRRSHGSQA